jgi:20S proteasome alpha/beta subunit
VTVSLSILLLVKKERRKKMSKQEARQIAKEAVGHLNARVDKKNGNLIISCLKQMKSYTKWAERIEKAVMQAMLPNWQIVHVGGGQVILSEMKGK